MTGELVLSSYTYNQGRIAINDAFSGSASFNTLSAETVYSGSTNLYDIFELKDSEDTTRIQSGLNTYTGGTANAPTVNISAATLNSLAVSGASSLGVVSATTIYSGSTELSTLFETLTTKPFQTLTYGATTYWGYDLGNNAKVTLSGDTTLDVTGVTDGCYGTIMIKQDRVGSRLLTLGTGTHKVVNGGGGAITLTSNADAEDILSFVYISTTFYWNIGYNYS